MFVRKKTRGRNERLFGRFLILACLVGCAGQGEGELCNRKAGNGGDDDCQSGLRCSLSVSPSPGFGLCCPSDPALAQAAACKGSSGGVKGDAAPPSATTGPGLPDARADATVEAGPSEASASDAAEPPDGGPSDASASEASIEAAGSDATSAGATGPDVAAPDAPEPDATGTDAGDARTE
jgi:hypothetical protein